MGFILFLLVTATLLIRPSEHLPELASIHIYEGLIILCFAFSISEVMQQFTLRSLETQAVTVCVLGLLAAVVLSQLSKGDAAAAAECGYDFFKLLVYYVLLVANLTTVLRLRIFATCLGVCALTFVTLAVLHYHDMITLPEPKTPISRLDKDKNEDRQKGAFLRDTEYDPESGQMVEYKRLRGTGIYGDPNDLSLLLTTGLFVALWLLSDPKQGVFRVAWLAALILFVYALSLTQSRGGLLAMLAGFLALFYARFGRMGLLLLGLPLIPLALAFFGGRMASITISEGTGQLRIQVWSVAIAALMSAPVFGIGMHGLVPLIGRVAHNSYVGAFAELGLVGGTLFLGTFFFAVLGLTSLIKQRQYIADLDLRRLLPFLLAVVLSYAVGLLSLSRVDSVQTYLVLGLAVAAGNVAAVRVPALAQRIDGWLVQRWAFASMAFLATTYLFVRFLQA